MPSHLAVLQRGGRVRSAFTLIEMLVVMAIIAILAGLVLTGIQAARASAQSVQCQSNLRQLGFGVIQYRDQYGFYPQYRAEYPPITNQYGVYRPGWQWIIASYMGGWAQNPNACLAMEPFDPTCETVPIDNPVLVCPALAGGTASTLNSNDYLSMRSGSYGYNFGYLGNNRTLVDGDNTTPTLYYPVASVKEPSRTIVFGDSRGGMIGHGGHSKTLDPPHMVFRFDGLTVNSPYWLQKPFGGTALAGVNPYGPDEGTPDIQVPFSPAEARHKGFANVVFLDGHTASLSLQGLGYNVVNGIPQLQLTAVPLPGADNSLWTGRGLDETSPFYNTQGP